MKRYRHLFISLLIIVSFSTYLISCDFFIGQNNQEDNNSVNTGQDMDGDGIPDDVDTDIDGDGLTNIAEETIWMTNPILSDTDGDGWNDGDETNMGAKFSPLLANLPELRLEITTTPEIILSGENTSSESKNYTIAKGTAVTSETTISSSLSESKALENAWSVEGMVGYGLGINAAGYSLTAGYSGSYTVESGYSWGKDMTESNTQDINESNSYAEDNSVTYDGGTLSVGARLVNPSTIAYTLDNLIISGYKMNTTNDDYGTYSLIGGGNLNIDGFSAMTLNANNGTSGEFIISKTFDSPDYARELARACPSMIFSVAGYTSSMTVNGETTDFTGEMTTVAALCAKVIVTTNDEEPSQQYLVAARTKYNKDYTSVDDLYETLSLSEILSNMGKVEGTDYFIDPADGHITTYDGITENPASNSQWIIMVQDLDDGLDIYTDEEGYDLGNIFIEPGYIVNIIYSIDRDEDGLVKSMEEMYGSSDELEDSDGDTIPDIDEVLGWDLPDGTTVYTNPALADTDGDGINDNVDDNPVGAFKHETANILTLSIKDRSDQDLSFNNSSDTFSGNKIIDEYAKISIKVEDPVKSVEFESHKMNKDTDDDTLYTIEIQSLPLGETDYTITVTSQDQKEVNDYTLTIESELADIDNLLLTDENFNKTTQKYQMDLGVNWGTYTDSRAIGALLLYIKGEDAPTNFEIPDSSLLPNTLKQDENGTEYASGEKAVYYWNSTGGTSQLETDSGEFFYASYFDTQYSFRLVTVGQKEDGTYVYSAGTPSTDFTTPFPDSINITDIHIVYDWDHTGGAESDPEFTINTDLRNLENNKVADLTTRTLSNHWKPKDTGNLVDSNNTAVRNYNIPNNNHDAKLFKISFYIEEDESLGEHLCVDDTKAFQFMEKSGDGAYGINRNNTYAARWLVEEETYVDNDKGEITISITIEYETKDTE